MCKTEATSASGGSAPDSLVCVSLLRILDRPLPPDARSAAYLVTWKPCTHRTVDPVSFYCRISGNGCCVTAVRRVGRATPVVDIG